MMPAGVQVRQELTRYHKIRAAQGGGSGVYTESTKFKKAAGDAFWAAVDFFIPPA